MSKKGVSTPEVYIPSIPSQSFISDMLAASHLYRNDEPWTDFEFEDLLQAWPEPSNIVAESIDATPASLTSFLSGNHGALRDDQILALRKLLCVHRDRFGGDYSQAEGPYILVPRSIPAATAAYGAATGGGDIQMCCEFVPKSKKGLKRAVEIQAPHLIGFTRLCSDISFILVPRESATLPAKWKKAFLNLAEDPVALGDEDFTAFLNTALFAAWSPNGRAWMLHLHSELYGKLLERLGVQQRGY